MLDKLAFWRRKPAPPPARRALNPLTVRDRVEQRRKHLQEQVLADLKSGHLGDQVPFPDVSRLQTRPEGVQHWANAALGLPPAFFIGPNGVEVRNPAPNAPSGGQKVHKSGFYAPVPASDEDRRLLRQLQELGEEPISSKDRQ